MAGAAHQQEISALRGRMLLAFGSHPWSLLSSEILRSRNDALIHIHIIYMYTCIYNTCIYEHTYMHAYIHAQIHIYTHLHIHICVTLFQGSQSQIKESQ